MMFGIAPNAAMLRMKCATRRRDDEGLVRAVALLITVVAINSMQGASQ
jgi:hypothetical protein